MLVKIKESWKAIFYLKILTFEELMSYSVHLMHLNRILIKKNYFITKKGWFHSRSERNYIVNKNFSFPKRIVPYQKKECFRIFFIRVGVDQSKMLHHYQMYNGLGRISWIMKRREMENQCISYPDLYKYQSFRFFMSGNCRYTSEFFFFFFNLKLTFVSPASLVNLSHIIFSV